MKQVLWSGLEILIGIALLFGGGELFVAGSLLLSLLLGIPQIGIDLTVVAMGTGAPELCVSLIATVQATRWAWPGAGVPAVLVLLTWQVLPWREQWRTAG